MWWGFTTEGGRAVGHWIRRGCSDRREIRAIFPVSTPDQTFGDG